MNTNHLIGQLAATPPPVRKLRSKSVLLLLTSFALVLLLKLFILHPRPDLLLQLSQPAYLLKLGALFLLATMLLILLWRSAQPAALQISFRLKFFTGASLALFLVCAFVAWLDRDSLTSYQLHCLLWISLYGLVPLAGFSWLLRRGAPTQPTLASYILGSAAWACASFGYALHCSADLALTPITGNLTMLFLYALALPIFWLLAFSVQRVWLRW